jgi:hypothetical protein
MADKIIKTASFWYAGPNGVERTALRGETVNITDEADLERGERLDAFATKDDLKPASLFGAWYTAYQANKKAAADAGMPELAEQPDEVVEQPDEVVEQPGGNDSRDKWVAYARSEDAPESELVPVAEGGLSRDALRDKYGA